MDCMHLWILEEDGPRTRTGSDSLGLGRELRSMGHFYLAAFVTFS